MNGSSGFSVLLLRFSKTTTANFSTHDPPPPPPPPLYRHWSGSDRESVRSGFSRIRGADVLDALSLGKLQCVVEESKTKTSFGEREGGRQGGNLQGGGGGSAFSGIIQVDKQVAQLILLKMRK